MAEFTTALEVVRKALLTCQRGVILPKEMWHWLLSPLRLDTVSRVLSALPAEDQMYLRKICRRWPLDSQDERDSELMALFREVSRWCDHGGPANAQERSLVEMLDDFAAELRVERFASTEPFIWLTHDLLSEKDAESYLECVDHSFRGFAKRIARGAYPRFIERIVRRAYRGFVKRIARDWGRPDFKGEAARAGEAFPQAVEVAYWKRNDGIAGIFWGRGRNGLAILAIEARVFRLREVPLEPTFPSVFELSASSRNSNGSVRWEASQLMYREMIPPIDLVPVPGKPRDGNRLRVGNSEEGWERLWITMDSLRAWEWTGDYSWNEKMQMRGGEHWRLEIQRGDRRLQCAGANRCDAAPPGFSRFLACLMSELLGEDLTGPAGLYKFLTERPSECS